MDEFICVLGLDNFGYRTAVTLRELGKQVLVVDRDENVIQRVADKVTKAVAADVRDQEVLRELGVPDADVVIIGLRRHFDVEVLVVHFLQKCGVRKIIVHVETEEKGEAIRAVGATHIVIPELDAAAHLAKSLAMPGLVEQVRVAKDVELIEVECPEAFIGKSLVDLELRRQYDIHVIGIIHKDPKSPGQTQTTIAPSPTHAFEKGETMLVLGKSGSLRKFVSVIQPAVPSHK